MPSGRNSRGSSAVDEQQRAVQAVRNIGKNGPGSSASAMAGASRSDAVVSGGPGLLSARQDREAQRNLLKGSDTLSKDMADKFSRPLIEEFLNNCDEAVSYQLIL